MPSGQSLELHHLTSASFFSSLFFLLHILLHCLPPPPPPPPHTHTGSCTLCYRYTKHAGPPMPLTVSYFHVFVHINASTWSTFLHFHKRRRRRRWRRRGGTKNLLTCQDSVQGSYPLWNFFWFHLPANPCLRDLTVIPLCLHCILSTLW